jgi:hypothetical protein
MERCVDGSGNLCHIGHERVPFCFREFEELVHMILIGHDAPTHVGLFLEQENSGYAQVTDFDHQVVLQLISGAVKAIGIFFHQGIRWFG